MFVVKSYLGQHIIEDIPSNLLDSILQTKMSYKNKIKITHLYELQTVKIVVILGDDDTCAVILDNDK